MTDLSALDAYGVLSEPDTLTIQRVLPGPVERVWAYLTEGDLRRQWLAAGTMELTIGAPFEFVWRNDELTDPPGERPAGYSAESRMQNRITELDPLKKIAFTWRDSGDVTIELEPIGTKVLLTLTHRRLPDRPTLLGVSAGWHLHLDVLSARMSNATPEPFWDGWNRLKAEYDRRIPA